MFIKFFEITIQWIGWNDLFVLERFIFKYAQLTTTKRGIEHLQVR